MAPSANPKTSSHEQVEYELGFLIDNGAAGLEAVYHTPKVSIPTPDPPVQQRKPPLSEPAKTYAKAMGGHS